MLIETDIFYRRTYECYALSDIEYVKGARRGVNQGGMNTIHFVLYAGLKDKIKLIKIRIKCVHEEPSSFNYTDFY